MTYCLCLTPDWRLWWKWHQSGHSQLKTQLFWVTYNIYLASWIKPKPSVIYDQRAYLESVIRRKAAFRTTTLSIELATNTDRWGKNMRKRLCCGKAWFCLTLVFADLPTASSWCCGWQSTHGRWSPHASLQRAHTCGNTYLCTLSTVFNNHAVENINAIYTAESYSVKYIPLRRSRAKLSMPKKTNEVIVIKWN